MTFGSNIFPSAHNILFGHRSKLFEEIKNVHISRPYQCHSFKSISFSPSAASQHSASAILRTSQQKTVKLMQLIALTRSRSEAAISKTTFYSLRDAVHRTFLWILADQETSKPSDCLTYLLVRLVSSFFWRKSISSYLQQADLTVIERFNVFYHLCFKSVCLNVLQGSLLLFGKNCMTYNRLSAFHHNEYILAQ